MQFKENSNRRVYNIDFDGILTIDRHFNLDAEPNYYNIAKVRELYQEGNIIIIHSARAWEFAPETVGWLIKHKIPFHGIYLQKGGSDCYIDDKAVNQL